MSFWKKYRESNKIFVPLDLIFAIAGTLFIIRWMYNYIWKNDIGEIELLLLCLIFIAGGISSTVAKYRKYKRENNENM